MGSTLQQHPTLCQIQSQALLATRKDALK